MAANNTKRKYFLPRLLFLVYLILLAYLLFFAEGMGRTGNSGRGYNLELFCEIKRFLYHADVLGWKIVAINLVGNVVAFMPFGYFIPRIFKRKIGAFGTIFYSFLFSLIVECLQYTSQAGSFDVDDLFLNTVGGLLGFIVYYCFHCAGKGEKGKEQ